MTPLPSSHRHERLNTAARLRCGLFYPTPNVARLARRRFFHFTFKEETQCCCSPGCNRKGSRSITPLD